MPPKAHKPTGKPKPSHRKLQALWLRLQRAWLRWAELNTKSFWFQPFLFAFNLVDTLVVVLPGDVVMALSVLADPKRNWWRSTLSAGLGRFFGYALAFTIAHHWGAEPLKRVMEDPQVDVFWTTAQDWIQNWGPLALVPLAFSPLACLCGAALSGIYGASAWLTLGSAALGTFLRFGLMGLGLKEGWQIFQSYKEQRRLKRQARISRRS